MSLIHIKDRKTTSEFEFNEQKSSQASLLLVNEEAKFDSFSLELTVGTAWAKVFSKIQKSLIQIDSNGIRIGRHDSIVIEVAEEIHVPNNMYGILVPTGSLFLGLGILIAPAKIEPGYSGKLTLRLFNTTSEKYILKAGHKLGSAIFFPTDTTLEHATIKRERGANTPTYGRLKRSWQWLKSNPHSWVNPLLGLIGSSTVAAFITIYLTNNLISTTKKPQTESNQQSAASASASAVSSPQK